MKKTFYFILLCLILGSINSYSSHVEISEPILYHENDKAYAMLNVRWDNAWKNDTNHDAVWLFFKFLKGERGYDHAKVLERGHKVTMNHIFPKQGIAFDVPEDQILKEPMAMEK